jgi:hypothetical protein
LLGLLSLFEFACLVAGRFGLGPCFGELLVRSCSFVGNEPLGSLRVELAFELWRIRIVRVERLRWINRGVNRRGWVYRWIDWGICGWVNRRLGTTSHRWHDLALRCEQKRSMPSAVDAFEFERPTTEKGEQDS